MCALGVCFRSYVLEYVIRVRDAGRSLYSDEVWGWAARIQGSELNECKTVFLILPWLSLEILAFAADDVTLRRRVVS